MKKLILLSMMSLGAIALAQQLFTYRDKSGAMSVRAKSGLVEQTSANQVHMVLKGSPVVIKSLNDGLTIQAPSVVCDANTKTKTKIGKAVATGGVHAIKSGAGGNTDITASTGTYTSTGQSSKLTLTGSTKIVSRSSTGTTTVTGGGGVANLDPSANGSGNGLRTATLTGPVRIEAVQQNTNGGTITATGSKLTIDNPAHTVTLSGGVNVTGNGQSTLGELRGADRVVLVLNSQGQIASVRVSQGGAN